MQKGNTARKDVRWTNKVAEFRMSGGCSKRKEGSRCMEVMIVYLSSFDFVSVKSDDSKKNFDNVRN